MFIRLSAGLLALGLLAMSIDSAATTPPRKLTLIGASYAAGWGTPTLPGFAVTNKGVGGEDTASVLARFDTDVIANRPDAVLIWGHINDIHRAPPGQMEQVKQRARANYERMHALADAAGIEVLFATEVTLTIGDGWIDNLIAYIGKLRGRENYRDVVNRHVKDVNNWLRQYAAQRGLRLLDLERAVDSGNGSRRDEYNQDDGSHINEAGYAALTRYAAASMR